MKVLNHSMTEVPASDGVPLALHRWDPVDPADARGLLYYVHGIQSHAGWLFETGPELARHGVLTFALDRRGSGHSGGMRGDLPSAELITDDYLVGLRAARAQAPELPVTVLGQSFGASILGALAASGALADERLVYCTPALGQQRARHDAERLAELRALTGLEYRPVALEDEDYTDQDRYLEFMANDPLMLRQITDRSRASMVELEQLYLERRAPGARTVHFVRTEHDPIIEQAAADRVLRELHGSLDVVTFPVRHHYIEFSPARRDYWAWLAETVAPAGQRL